MTSNSVHPGLVDSGFNSNTTGFNRLLHSVLKPFSLIPQQGAQTSLYLATSPQVAGITGQYFANKKVARANRVAYDEEAQERLWQLSEKLLLPWLDPVKDGPTEVRA